MEEGPMPGRMFPQVWRDGDGMPMRDDNTSGTRRQHVNPSPAIAGRGRALPTPVAPRRHLEPVVGVQHHHGVLQPLPRQVRSVLDPPILPQHPVPGEELLPPRRTSPAPSRPSSPPRLQELDEGPVARPRPRHVPAPVVLEQCRRSSGPSSVDEGMRSVKRLLPCPLSWQRGRTRVRPRRRIKPEVYLPARSRLFGSSTLAIGIRTRPGGRSVPQRSRDLISS